MTDCYKTEREALKEAQSKYNNLINRIDKEIRRHRTLEQGIEKGDYRLAHSMVADYLEELKEEVQNGK